MELHGADRWASATVRTSAATWDDFLAHLATMSPLAASRLPGMPSPKAFSNKRARDPSFRARAKAIMDGRRIRGSGFHRSTPEQWATFLDLVRSCCVPTACRRPGMPSEKAVYKRRARDFVFAAALAEREAPRPKIEKVKRVRVFVPRVKKSKPAASHRADAFRARHDGMEALREHLYGNALYGAAMAGSHPSGSERDGRHLVRHGARCARGES